VGGGECQSTTGKTRKKGKEQYRRGQKRGEHAETLPRGGRMFVGQRDIFRNQGAKRGVGTIWPVGEKGLIGFGGKGSRLEKNRRGSL